MSDASPPRVGIIGNMNNGGFAIMRYFRDLGVDAKLFPFSTDGSGNLAHFHPNADTWEIERWRPCIQTLTLPNSISALSLRHGRQRQAAGELLADRTHLVGSGLTPALMQTLGRRLDVFFPYGIGIEFYGDLELRSLMSRSPLHRVRYGRMRRLQAKGIARARHRFNAELSHTAASFDELGLPFDRIALPAVYNGRDARPDGTPAGLVEVRRRMEQADLAVACFSRMLWVRDPRLTNDQWASFTKNSDWMIRGLAEHRRRNPDARTVLAIAEYGPDVEATKALAAELGVADQIVWLPLMARREIMLLLSWADAGVGEFYTDEGVIWGGTGWEVLASGKPLLQSFNFTRDGYSATFGHAPPPILDVKSAAGFAERLNELSGYGDRGAAVGAASLEWFNTHNGLGLSRRWLEIILDRPQ